MSLVELVQVGAVFVGVVFWFARLEWKSSRAKELAKEAMEEANELRGKLENFDSKIVEKLTEVRESLARLEGAVGTLAKK